MSHDLRHSGDSRIGDAVRTQKRLGLMTNERGLKPLPIAVAIWSKVFLEDESWRDAGR